jgi:hypothetical protein
MLPKFFSEMEVASIPDDKTIYEWVVVDRLNPLHANVLALLSLSLVVHQLFCIA